MIEEKIKKLIQESLKKIGIESAEVVLEHPAEITNGDFSTNIALALAKSLKMKPRELAGKILVELEKSKPRDFERLEIAGPGFINFYLAKTFFTENVATVLKEGGNFGKNSTRKGEKIIVEYTNTNLFKELHIGHMMSNNIGESLSRIWEFQAAEVKRDTYQGDVGLHVAKAIFGMQKLVSEMPKESASLHEKIVFLGKAYAAGSVAYDEDKTSEARIKELNKIIFEKSDSEINQLYAWGREVSLAHFEILYKKLDTKFDYYFFETEVAEKALAIVTDNLKTGIFEKSDGAVVFKGEQYGLHTRVFINSMGLPTYEAKDIGLAFVKYEKYPFDRAVIITANEQNDYFKVVLKALSLIDAKLAGKIKHLSHGMLKLSTGKMSSRTGNVITGEALIDSVEAMVHKKIEDRELETFERNKIAEAVAIGAIKYSILRQAIGGDIIFDFDKSISFEGDSGPYLQYSFVRANSILAKAAAEKILPDFKHVPDEIFLIERMLTRFPEVVVRAGADFAPHLIATYLIELSSSFNSYYAQNQIVNSGDPTSSYKVALTSAFAQVMKNGLWLLGIPVPSKM
ncbi:MAG: arginine--tRNA ligase [Patescibacteria group bacterium]